MAYRTQRFLGYTTKPGAYIENFEVAQDCSDVCVNKGDLCNLPYPKSVVVNFRLPRYLDLQIFNSLYTLQNLHFYIKADKVVDKWGINAWEIVDDELINSLAVLFPVMSGVSPEYLENLDFVHGNMLQVGEWLYLISVLAPILPDEPLPRMLRVKAVGNSEGVPRDYTLKISPVGLETPVQVVSSITSTSSTYTTWITNKSYKFAVGFVTNINGETKSGSAARVTPDDTTSDPDGDEWQNNLDADDIESNVVITEDELAGTGIAANEINLRVAIPEEMELETTVNTAVKLAVYVQIKGQSNYYFIGYFDTGLVSEDRIDVTINKVKKELLYFDVLVASPGPAVIQDLNKVIPLTGETGPIIGAHDIPRAAYHAAYFKNRMYSAPLGAPVQFTDFAEAAINRLQASARTPIDEVDVGKYVNYIEVEKFIGSSTTHITGIIEWLSQLVIFKEDKTYVINDDILVGDLRTLFTSLGCVNTHGGKAYIVVEEKLYWLDVSGLWRYDGDSEPEHLSVIIEEDLKKISKDRFSRARLSVDIKHKHIYLTFPPTKDSPENIPAFIFHYGENGVWTKTSLLRNLFNMRRFNTGTNLAIYRDRLEVLGEIDDDSIIDPLREPFWKSIQLAMGDLSIRKHWRGFKIFMSVKQEREIKFLPHLDGETSRTVDGKVNVFHPLNLHSKLFACSLFFLGKVFKPFRIAGLELKGHIRGSK